MAMQVDNGAADMGIANKTNGCIAEEYSGSTCSDQLYRLMECYRQNSSSGQTNGIIEVCRTSVNTRDDGDPLGKGERLAKDLQHGQSLFSQYLSISKNCKAQLEPFACLYLFPLAVRGDKPGLGPAASRCVAIRDKVCPELWKMIEQFGQAFDVSLPNCEALEEHKDLIQICNDSG